jgi:hypothetical protein
MIERRSFKPLSVWDGDNFRLRSRASTATLTHAGTTWKCRALKTSQYGKAIGQPHLVTLMLWLRVEATIIKFRREMFFSPAQARQCTCGAARLEPQVFLRPATHLPAVADSEAECLFRRGKEFGGHPPSKTVMRSLNRHSKSSIMPIELAFLRLFDFGLQAAWQRRSEARQAPVRLPVMTTPEDSRLKKLILATAAAS